MWVVNFGLERSAKYTYNWHKNVKKKRYMMNLFSIYLAPFNESKWGLKLDQIGTTISIITCKNIEGLFHEFRNRFMKLIPIIAVNKKSQVNLKINNKLLALNHPWLRFLNVDEIEEV